MKMPFECRNLQLPDGDRIPTGKELCWSPRVWDFMELPEQYLIGPRGGIKFNREYYAARPSRELLATVDFQVVMNFYGLGPKGRQCLIDYLAEGGLKFKNQPEVWPPQKNAGQRPITEKRIKDAIRLLDRCGCDVTKREP